MVILRNFLKVCSLTFRKKSYLISHLQAMLFIKYDVYTFLLGLRFKFFFHKNTQILTFNLPH